MADEIRELPKGYTDTPVIPGQRWRVHDIERPAPPVVTPATGSTQQSPGRPPSDAVILFDGSSLAAWESARDGGEAPWKLIDGAAMEVVGRSGNIQSKRHFGSCQLHVEWSAPTQIRADSQGRGNSGVFLMGHYEIQVLDGYDNPTYADGLTGAIYGQYPPLANAGVPPGSWNVFDIVFEAPVYESGAIKSPATLTVFHNGVLLHLRQPIQGPTKHRALASYDEEHGPEGPLVLQDHGDPVRFRNIWLRPIERFEAE